jgi:hypothetical protein
VIDEMCGALGHATTTATGAHGPAFAGTIASWR